MSAVTNAGPLIHLSWIDRLDLLPALFGEVVAPPAVRDEVLRASPDIPGVAAIRAAFDAGWLVVEGVEDAAAIDVLASDIDRGEAEAIVLMRQTAADVLLLDDRRARSHAQRERLPLTGTIGLLRMARDRGLIPAVVPLLEVLRLSGFRVSAELLAQIRREEPPAGQA